MSKRISEVAKEWGVPAKDVIARLEQMGITGRRAQSNIADDEIARVRVAMGLVQEPAVSVGGERVVGERIVTEHGIGASRRDWLVPQRGERAVAVPFLEQMQRRRVAAEQGAGEMI